MTTAVMTSKMVFSRETMDAYKEAKPLLEAHYKEISHYQDIALKVDQNSYMALEKAGYLRIYVARVDGKMVGYAVFLIKRNIHYINSLQALQDVLYIDPGHRGKGLKFIAWCDDQLREESIQVVYHHVKLSHDFGKALERIGYERIETIYGRRLDE